MVEVVNMRTCDPPFGQPGDVRIDRMSKWGNPHLMHNNSEAERNRVCDLYERDFDKYGLDISELLAAKRLGCWCKPKRCHGDFLKALIENKNTCLQQRLI